ncbi:hypothetical protein D917_05723 [Trichinella nativa]|uniref:Uncharacterized protein n=1 Tax=Trichinella nativa TaxID=6335 RepID=A0A1Y3EVW1_9BILA|nr:hypothetical protein D917_05723 [Trichinella nativa]
MEVGFVVESLTACMPAYLLENDTVAVFLWNDELRIIFAASIGPDKSISLFVLALPSNWQSTGYSLHTVKNRTKVKPELLTVTMLSSIQRTKQSAMDKHLHWQWHGIDQVGVHDMVLLATVDEDAIVQNLRKRYMNSIMFLRETNIFCPIRPQQPYESFRWSKMAHDAQHFAHGESSSSNE